MRNKYKLTLFSVVLILIGFMGCNETEVSDPVAPGGIGGFINTEFTQSNTSGSFREGESITINIKMDRTFDYAISFDFILLPDSEADADDIEIVGGTVNAYQTETQITISALDELTAEVLEKLKFEISVNDLAVKYLMNPDFVYPVFEYTIEPPTTLLVQMDWDTEDDFDFVIYKDDAGYPFSDSSAMAATGAQPEKDNSIDLSEAGTYYVGIMNWGASANYTFTLGKPNGTVETITGSFDGDNLDKYYIDLWKAWGGAYPSYRILKIVNDGTDFTITKLDELTGADYVSASSLVGDWDGTDGTYNAENDWLGDSYVTTYNSDGKIMIQGLNFWWMQAIWGELPLSSDSVEMIVYANGDVLIPYQDYWTTFYDDDDTDTIPGGEFPYQIYGTGSYSGGALHLEYELDQAGSLIAGWAFDNGYSDIPYFIADLTLGAKKGSPLIKKDAHIAKPTRMQNFSPKVDINSIKNK